MPQVREEGIKTVQVTAEIAEAPEVLLLPRNFNLQLPHLITEVVLQSHSVVYMCPGPLVGLSQAQILRLLLLDNRQPLI